MLHYLYCIENLINGKVYVGKHSTDDMDDGYMGSGKLLNAAIRKHGIENFRKHVLLTLDTSEAALDIERQLVNEEFVADENTYNVKIGGKGGSVPGRKESEEIRQRRSESARRVQARPDVKDHQRKIRLNVKRSDVTRQRISQSGLAAQTPEVRKRKSQGQAHRMHAVIQHDLDGNEIAHYASISQAIKATGCSGSQIRNCCKNFSKRIKGFRWRDVIKKE